MLKGHFSETMKKFPLMAYWNVKTLDLFTMTFTHPLALFDLPFKKPKEVFRPPVSKLILKVGGQENHYTFYDGTQVVKRRCFDSVIK